MGSFIEEVEDSLRGDRLQTVWRRGRWWLFGLSGAFVLLVAAWEGWSSWREDALESAMLSYREALAVSDGAFEAWREEQDALIAAEAEAAEAAAVAEVEADGEALPTFPADIPVERIGEEVGLGAAFQSGLDSRVSDSELRRELGVVDLYYDADELSGLFPLGDDSVLGVRLMSLLQLAVRHYESERYAEADAAWLRVIGDTEFPSLYRDLARVLRANALLGRVESALLRSDLELLANNFGNPFWSTATEVLALLHLEEDEVFLARGYLEALNSEENESVPRGMRRRANRLLSLLDERELLIEESVEESVKESVE
ncbi:MAG: hypothetical protein OD811_00070 [Alphaproteobacteria bacterium]